MDAVYTGPLSVEEESFNLVTERLTLRDEGVAFTLTGRDKNYGEFSIEGVAPLSEHGFYFASKLDVNYLAYKDGEDTASVKFTVVKQTPPGQKCKVEGEWVEAHESWPFNGDLVLMV